MVVEMLENAGKSSDLHASGAMAGVGVSFAPCPLNRPARKLKSAPISACGDSSSVGIKIGTEGAASVIRSASLPRYSSLRSRQSLRRNGYIRRQSPKQRARQATWKRVTAEAIRLAGGRCQIGIAGVCRGKASEGHHKRGRGQARDDTLGNCLPACHWCHAWATSHPAEAVAMGFSISRKGAA
jgi:hypothetical protein